MNTKKTLSLSAILIFIGGFFTFITALIFSSTIENRLVRPLLNYIPEIALGIFLLYIGNTLKNRNLRKIKNFWITLFIICIIVALIEFCCYFINYNSLTENRIIASNYLKWLPLSNIFSRLYLLYRQIRSAILIRKFLIPIRFFIQVIGEILVFISFIVALKTLNHAANNPDCIKDSDYAKKDSSATNESSVSTDIQNPSETKMMSFGEAIKSCYRNYFSFEGCATRAEYWWFYLYCVIVKSVLLIPALICAYSGNTKSAIFFLTIAVCFAISTMLPAISVGVRRMHDCGFMGFMLYLPFVNIVFLLLPSVPSSEYRTKINLHPIASGIAKILIIIGAFIYYKTFISTISLRMYMANLNSSLYNRSYADSYDEDYDEDDSDYYEWWTNNE